MMRSLWISKTGLDAMQTKMDVISNNLANVSTNGFKKSTAVFEDLLYQNMRQSGAQSTQTSAIPAGLQIGTGVRPVSTTRLHTQGNLSKTDNSLDLAVNGNGFFQIQLPDGTTGYTRDGSFHTDANGQIVNGEGFPLSPAITVPPNATSITIGADGTITAMQQGNVNPTQIGSIQLATFINPAGLESKGGNLYGETASSGTPQTGTPGANGVGTVNQGYVETSNVNVVEELVNMIQTQRAYEINSKSITTSDQMLQKLTQL
ncbi:flagellar basal-body rod protein FlgG [Derxia gummosa]|uniref:Flagellar basal-body rod protein FlgG n=1 Tax=Derxia gummosa DSM 723 TaxID=1121388 RepID=A0A8B6X6Q2_9BURK|nr:flagellar basal-body rod protein FlgG [Derxia gummosa]